MVVMVWCGYVRPRRPSRPEPPNPYLQAVGHDLSGETAAEEADEAVLLDDALEGLGVGHVLLVGLLVDLFGVGVGWVSGQSTSTATNRPKPFQNVP